MESKMDLKDLIIREFERTLEQKVQVEGKAANYMIVVTLILTIIVQFFLELNKKSFCSQFTLTYYIFYIGSFSFGVLLLLVFALMLQPKHIKYFSTKELLDEYHNKEKSDEDKGSRGHPGPLTHKKAAERIFDFISSLQNL